MKSREAARKGSLVAEVLAGAWRAAPFPTLQVSGRELDEVTPLLYDSGTAALGWRPLWLCDVGVAIEALPAGFAWDICLGRNHTRAHWIMSAIGLAKRLLGVDTAKVPAEIEAELPAWLIGNVLKQWANPFAIDQPPMSHPIPMADLLRHP